MHNSLWLWSLYFLKFYVEISLQKKSNLFVMFYVTFSASSREWPFCWSRERLISIVLYICLVVNLFQKRVCEYLGWALLVERISCEIIWVIRKNRRKRCVLSITSKYFKWKV